MKRVQKWRLGILALAAVALAWWTWDDWDYYFYTWKYYLTSHPPKPRAFQICSTNQGFTAFGDSITEGVEGTIPQNGWPALLATEMNWALTNKAIGGFQCPDTAPAIYNEHTPLRSTFTFMMGTGDSVRSAEHPGAFQSWHLADAAWLAIPDEAKEAGTSRKIHYQGHWMSKAAYPIGKITSAPGATATIANLNGATILLGYARRSAEHHDSGTFILTVDGKRWGETFETSLGFNFTPHATITNQAVPYAIALTNLAPGPHTLVLTVTSAQGTVELDWIAALSGTSNAAWPKVFVGNIPPQNDRFENNEKTIALFNGIIAENCRQLHDWGLNVFLVDVSNALDRKSDFVDQFHPNDSGSIKLKQAFRNAMMGR